MPTEEYKANSAWYCENHFLILFYHFYIYTRVYIVCLGYSPTPTPCFWAELFCILILWFCWRENIRDNKNNSVLLVWDKDRYTERFLALLPCTCVLQPKLVHLYLPDLTTSRSPSHSGLCQFNKITVFAPIQWAHQLHSSFRFPSLSLFLPCAFSL
jgi:hypothetical protein